MTHYTITTSSIPKSDGTQQDYIYHEFLSSNALLIIVADGMGAYTTGEIAAQLSVTTIAQTIKSHWQSGSAIEELFQLAFIQADYVIKQEVALCKKRLGAAVTAALIVDNMLHVAWLGDVRCYIHSMDGIYHMNEDHKLPNSNSLFRALNGRGFEKRVPVLSIPIDECKQILLCTDGYYNQVNHDVLFEAITTNDFASDGHDDCSYVAVRLK